jgi:hypothetical protein
MYHIPFHEITGLLMYIANSTRLNIAYATNILTQVMHNLGCIHWHAAKQIVRYLKGTQNLQLTYGKNNQGLFAYADVSHTTEDINYKSMSGYVMFLNRGAFSWSVKKQPIITLSSAKAEYVALTHASQEIL